MRQHPQHNTLSQTVTYETLVALFEEKISATATRKRPYMSLVSVKYCSKNYLYKKT